MTPRAQLLTAGATLLVASGAGLVWQFAPRLAGGPILADLAPLVAGIAVLVFLAAADAAVRWSQRRHRSDRS